VIVGYALAPYRPKTVEEQGPRGEGHTSMLDGMVSAWGVEAHIGNDPLAVANVHLFWFRGTQAQIDAMEQDSSVLVLSYE
jgi:hypothetical protein